MTASPLITSLPNTLSSFSLKKFMRGKERAEQLEDTLADTAPERLDKVSLIGNAVHQSLMSGKFISAQSSPSKYVSAQLHSLSAVKETRLQEQSSMMELLNQFGGLSTSAAEEPGAKRKRVGSKAAEIEMALRRRAAKQVLEGAKEDLRQAKKYIEDKVQETLTRQDAVGDPLPQVDGTISTGSVSTASVIDIGEVGTAEVVTAAIALASCVPAVPVPAAYVSSASAARLSARGRSVGITV